MVVIQMDMQSRNHMVMMLMLQFGEALGKRAHVMIVNHRQSADHRAIGMLRRLRDQRFANQIAKRFGERLVYPRPEIKRSNFRNRSESIATPMRLSSPMSILRLAQRYRG